MIVLKKFEHEVDNTKSIYKVVKMALDEEDWASWNFLQWFVKEQIEEENLASLLLDKIQNCRWRKQMVMHYTY
jgi:ferritin